MRNHLDIGERGASAPCWRRKQGADAPRSPQAGGNSITLPAVRALIAEMFRPAHLFLSPDLTLDWEHREAEELVWEIFRGRLLDPAHTRERRVFEAWNAYQLTAPGERASEPLLAVKLDAEAGCLFVVRGLDCYVWEGYDAGGNVYQSRERRKWVRELAGTIQLNRLADLEELRDELACLLFQAVAGASRLPLASVETPLPDFSFGRLLYCHRPAAPPASGPLTAWRELVAEMLIPALNVREEAHLLETFLHAAPADDMSEAARVFVARWTEFGRTADDLSALLRTLFNEVSLSPYTDLVEKTLAFLHALDEAGSFRIDHIVDFLSFLLRHIGRHLSAYDLVTFHHRGANYPDALLLDTVLKEYLALLERQPRLFLAEADDEEAAQRHKRIRRRALRQGWLLRRRYEGHPVPELPTSPGENMRVLPPSHPRVPEEQIAQPARRPRRLYADDPRRLQDHPQTASALRQSFLDLEHPREWRELGLAVFLDRPLGIGKAAGEPDATLLLSAEAFSLSLARERLDALARELEVHSEDEVFRRHLAQPPLAGVPLDALDSTVRPGAVALADARRAAADFVFLRSTPGSVRTFGNQYDFAPLAQRFRIGDVLDGADVLIARAAGGTLVIHDARGRPRLELETITEGGFVSRAGQEYPAAGLRVLRVWEASDGEELHQIDLRKEVVRISG